MLNSTLLGRYEIKKQVRENDLFTEYWGQDAQTGRDITVIALHADLMPAGEFLARLEALTRKLPNLKSKHTPALIASGEAAGQAVIVREYIEGQALARLIESGSGLPLDMVLDIARQLGEHLDTIHSLGLAQIFFTPEDVMLSAGNPVQVTNFGIGQGLNIGGLLAENKIQARSTYAPELLKSPETDTRIDFYSLGALLFHLLTGREFQPAFEAADKTLLAEFLPSRLRTEIPSEWDVLVAKCLQPHPAKRIQSAVEFLHQLNDIESAPTAVSSGNAISMEDSLVGQTLGGYRLVSRLGQGGMATVYKAYEPALDRYVAIKVLPQFFAKDPVFVQRFKREAKAVAQLNHPNIVPIYSYGEAGGITYIAMQFVVGDTLKHEGQKFSFEESLRLLAPIARAVGYAHQRGIVHRDIKPSNILLADGNWPLLADFGLAQMAQVSGKLTESGVGMGTPMYMSPEQGQGDKVDQRTDIYSLGIVLYELTTGDVPFRADTPMAIVIKHINAPMPMPRSVNPDIPDYLEAIILKATAKNPEDRYQSGEELALAMENALKRLSSSARTVAAPEAQQKPAQPQSKPVKAEAAQSSNVKKILRALLILMAACICLPLLGVTLMGVFDICPPPGPWSQPPWCEGSPYQIPSFDGSVKTTPEPTAAPAVVLDDFEGNPPAGRSGWETYFEDTKDTELDCGVEDSRELRDSNYLHFGFDVADNSWGTCGFYFDSPQNWQMGHGIGFYLRADQANMPYEIILAGGTSDDQKMYLYAAKTPPASVNEWVRIEVPWSDILGVEWEDHAGKPFDPTSVNGFLLSISAGEGRQKGALWIDDLTLLADTPSANTSGNLFADDFENPAWTRVETYTQENTDTTSTCALDPAVARESAFSLKFQFDAAPNAWATCGFAFDTTRDWRAGKGIGFQMRADKPDLAYLVTIVTSPADTDQTYTYTVLTTAESVDGWIKVEIPWKDFLRVDWEDNAGAPLDPVAVTGLWFEADSFSAAREAGTLWVDDLQVIP